MCEIVEKEVKRCSETLEKLNECDRYNSGQYFAEIL